MDENDETKELLEKAIDEVVAKQLDLGIDIITDGEMERGNYFLHFVKHIKGMNPENLAEKVIRDGKLQIQLYLYASLIFILRIILKRSL